MNRRTLLATVVLLIAARPALAQDPTPRHPDQLDLAPLELTLPAPVDTVLSNGIRVR